MYTIQIIKEDSIWDSFVKNQPDTLFVQSPSYGLFYQAKGEQYWIYGIYENDQLVGGSLVLSTHAKRGRFLYLPYGPYLPEKEKNEALRALTDALADLAKKESYHFIRTSPYLAAAKENELLFEINGYRDAPMHVLAEETMILDISASEEILLAGMKKNHRNLIRRCIRGGVTVEMSTNVSDLEAFHAMHDATAKRHDFYRFSRTYIEQEFEAFAKQNEAVLFTATLPDGRVDASAIIMYYGRMAAYRHGASYGYDAHLPSSYLIQWEAIREAKCRGMRRYNFWGVAPEGASPRHPFFGITHFKKGFGGEIKTLVHCKDKVISFQYWINWIIETLRRLRRGF